MIEELILCSIISARIDKIIDEKLNRNVRPQLNLFIKKPYGYGFSTMMLELQEKGYVNYINDFTTAGLVGTARKGVIYEGSLANSGYKVTAIDELRLLDQKAKKVILELTELSRATRVLQSMTEKRVEKRITGGKYILDSGRLIIEVKTAFVFGTASDDALSDPDIKMLMTRCFCVNLMMSVDEAIELKARGRKIRVNSKVIPEEPVEEVILPEQINDMLLESLTSKILVDPSDGGYFTRAHDDLIRLAAIRAVARKRTEISKSDAEFAMKLYPLHQIGYLGTQLSDNELKVYQYCTGNKASKIAGKTGISKRQVYRILSKLIHMGLILKVGDRYYCALENTKLNEPDE